jgi:hypothetical protein
MQPGGKKMANPNYDEEKNEIVELPFACNLDALDAEHRKRHLDVTRRLHQSIEEVSELTDGYAFRLPVSSDSIMLASEFVTGERVCCPFFKFEVIVEKAGGPLWLKLRGREGVKDFIQAEMKIPDPGHGF